MLLSHSKILHKIRLVQLSKRANFKHLCAKCWYEVAKVWLLRYAARGEISCNNKVVLLDCRETNRVNIYTVASLRLWSFHFLCNHVWSFERFLNIQKDSERFLKTLRISKKILKNFGRLWYILKDSKQLWKF